jgi:hypothetical protein
MKRPFRVGEKYRNRHGEYEVVRLEEPKMMIRYADGQVLETDVELQARIWQNIQMEESITTLQKETAPSPRSPRSAGGGGQFHGLQEHDFQRGTAGTSWRARENLGGLLAQVMSDTTKSLFQSYAIYRQAEVHIVQPAYYVVEERRRWREAKFVFRLDTQGANFGFYIEKNWDTMDGTWDWLNFLKALEDDTFLQQKIQAAMLQLQLRWEACIHRDDELDAVVEATQGGLRWRENQKEAESITWSAFVERLKAIETEKWCDLYLLAHMPKDRAIALGAGIAKPVTEVYRALLPLYVASTKAG